MEPSLAPGLDYAARITARQQHVDALNQWSFMRIAPPAALRGWIGGYCEYSEHTRGFSTRRELPHAEGVLILNLGDPVQITGGDGRLLALRAGEGFVAGAHLQPALSHSGGRQSGIQIELPLATLRRLLGRPMHTLCEQVVDLRTLWGASGVVPLQRLLETGTSEGRVALLDALLIRRLQIAPVLDRRRLAALDLLRHAPQLDLNGIAARVGWSRKHLATQITDTVGVGPRCFRRLLRFQGLQQKLRALGQRPPDWAELAAQAGYCDQSHLHREFREFARMTPGEFERRRLADGGGVVER